MKRELLIDQIRTDGDTQAREKLSQDTVLEYAEIQNMPDVVVFHDGTDYWLADGFHRVMAAIHAKKKHVSAEVKKGSKLDAAWYACGANAAHGLRRTNADKRKAVRMAMELEGGKSLQVLADHCGVHIDTVRAVKKEVESGGRNRPPDHTETPTKVHNPPPTIPSKNPPPEASSKIGPPPAPRVTGKDGKSYPAAKVPDRVKDLEGRYVPEDVLDLWNRRQEAQDILSAISRLKSAVEKAQESQDKLFSLVHFNRVLILLKDLYSELLEARPHAVCPTCQGGGCNTCKGSGLVSKMVWERVPANYREEIAKLIREQK